MFRLHSLSLRAHPTLSDIDVTFSPEEGTVKEKGLFTSVMIGMNGTGKSYILKAIGDLFFEINRCKTSDVKEKVTFAFKVRYTIDNEVFDVFSSQWIKHENASVNKDLSGIYAFKGMPEFRKSFHKDFLYHFKLDEAIPLNDIPLPSKVIASSTQLNDRFTFKNDEESSVYKYCGVKRTARNISTNAFKRNIAESLLRTIAYPGFSQSLESALSKYLDFDPYLKVHYRTKYTSNFFDGNLTIEKLRDFYIRYKETRNRKTEPWGTWRFNQLEREYSQWDKSLLESPLESVISYINSLYRNGYLSHVSNTDSKRISIDFFDDSTIYWDSHLIFILQQLDLIYLEWIELKKYGKSVDLDKTSAGENQIIMSLLTILSKIEYDSLVLIDEPEISLHPNWQMAYIDLLKLMFGEFSDSHFIIATHSHFIISDLKSESSSVISLKRNNNKLYVEEVLSDTFGWSAEKILLEIFNVTTTRNFFIAGRIGEILELVSKKDRNEKLISQKVNELLQLNILSLPSDDPLSSVWSKLVSKYG
ncbi:MAG: hypothetical protein C0433_10260 [Cyclobacterium sp.]|nr:hypothetical protein [Cyclobacterium sp.]